MSEIQILSEMSAVRLNPGMYVGSVGSDGAHQLLFELIHNALDEAILGFCDEISITLNRTRAVVEDNGRGIPTNLHKETGRPACEVALTRLHAGSKFEGSRLGYTSGLHGVGLSCVNALSQELNLTVHYSGRKYQQTYNQGRPLFDLRELEPVLLQGTAIEFIPDPVIFDSFSEFDYDRCRDFVEKLAYLHPGVRFQIGDLTGGRHASYCNAENALPLMFERRTQDLNMLMKLPVHMMHGSNVVNLEAVFSWSTDARPHEISFVNSIETTSGGTHVRAFYEGLALGIQAWIRKELDPNMSVSIDEVSEGLVSIMSIRVLNPKFNGQIKSKLTNEEVVEPIRAAVFEKTLELLRQHKSIGHSLFERITESRRIRTAIRRSAESIYLRNNPLVINEQMYKEQFGARSKNWHDSAVWITHQELLGSHADLCDVDSKAVVLDVCCGSGVVGASFRDRVSKVVGLDLTPEMVNLAKTRLDEVHQGTVYQIPFADNSFDMVCTREVLHLLPFPEKPVSEIYRVLKPGGQFIVGQILPFSESDAAWMYRVFKKKQPLIFNMFQEEDFRSLLISAGFKDLKMKEINVWESIDVWIDSYETTALHQHEIRELFKSAPIEARAAHPFKIAADGSIQDLWRWCIFSVRKPI